jgi:formimidoylglutamate deiminase
MAGLSENLAQGKEEDDFWSWRDSMYQLALNLGPEQIQTIAEYLYSQMLSNGFTSVCEFHYLHHQKDGSEYKDLGEISKRLMQAAINTGISMTMVPVYYNQSDFGKAAKHQQRRFISRDTDHYFKLIESAQGFSGQSRLLKVGVGIHSLRAATQEDVKTVFARKDIKPRHIHIAEQTKEVASCEKIWGSRPVQWLLDNVDLDENCHLVHATHMTEKETVGLANSRAVAVICATTEANLGDGLFPMQTYLKHSGRYSIGTDSHVRIDPLEELRLLDFGQRLSTQKRNILCQQGGQESAELSYKMSYLAGRSGVGHSETMFAAGSSFDAVIIDGEHPVICARPVEKILASLIYAGDKSMIKGVMKAGKLVVQNQRHKNHESIGKKYGDCMRELSK